MTERPTVLLVEDDPIIREMMHEVLEDEGFHTVCAECTRDAIETMGPDGDGFTSSSSPTSTLAIKAAAMKWRATPGK